MDRHLDLPGLRHQLRLELEHAVAQFTIFASIRSTGGSELEVADTASV
jgi:hypothetical protein